LLPPDFYRLPTLELAPALLGRLFVRKRGDALLAGRIVEVEAYHQDGDRAAHSFGGETARNRIMFGSPGHLYVYFIYGMHFCMNVTSEVEGVGAAVLIRALAPVRGIELMRALRGPRIADAQLTNGPAKACAALGIDRGLDGASLQGPDVWIEAGTPPAPAEVATATRIGITKSAELPWRFFIEGNPYVSRRR